MALQVFGHDEAHACSRAIRVQVLDLQGETCAVERIHQGDAIAGVVDVHGKPINGLYVAGNDMASVMGGHYPSGGITLGPAMTFGWILAHHAAGRPLPLPEPPEVPPNTSPEALPASRSDARSTPSPQDLRA